MYFLFLIIIFILVLVHIIHQIEEEKKRFVVPSIASYQITLLLFDRAQPNGSEVS